MPATRNNFLLSASSPAKTRKLHILKVKSASQKNYQGQATMPALGVIMASSGHMHNFLAMFTTI